MNLTIKARVRGGMGVVIGPTLVFLSVWAAVPVAVYLLAPSASGVAYWVAVGLGLPFAVVLSVVFYRDFSKWAKGRAACLFLNQGQLRWGRHAIDLKESYRASLRVDSQSGSWALSMDLRAGKRNLHLFSRQVDLERVRSVFPEVGFLLPGALGPEEGAPAWVIDAEDVLQLLPVLWLQREQNTLFQTYLRFPWGKPLAGIPPTETFLPFDSPTAQANIACAICALKPKEIWLTAEAVLFREEDRVRSIPLGVHRLEAVSFGESSLRWFRFADRTFWLDSDEGSPEIDFVLRYVNQR